MKRFGGVIVTPLSTIAPPNARQFMPKIPSISTAILAASLLLWTPAHARSKPQPKAAIPQPAIGSPAQRLVQAYLLGLEDYTAPASIEKLDAVIKANRSTVPQLGLMASETRLSELAGYRAALTQLHSMGAPAPVLSLYTPALAALVVPVMVTESARIQFPQDNSAQEISSTLDEAEQIAPADSGTLTSWLKLSRGRDALWAYHIGNLDAVLRAGIPGELSQLPLIHGSAALAESAPIGCPKPLIDDLNHLADQANENRVDASTLASLDIAIQDVFGPGPTALSTQTTPVAAAKQ